MFKKAIPWQHKFIWFFKTWRFKVIITVDLNILSSCTPLYGMQHFLQFLFTVESMRIPGNDRRRNLDNFYFQEFYRDNTSKVYNRQKEFCQKIFEKLHTMLGQRRKFWFLEPLFWEFIIFKQISMGRNRTTS